MKINLIIFCLLSVLLAGCDQAGSTDAVVAPRNVILVIGDGMGEQQVTIARTYLVGSGGDLTFDKMPVRSASRVLTVNEANPEQPVYVADSANSATAIATGVITSKGRIATTAKYNQDIPTIVEMAKQAGLRTGIVSTAAITDATPASFMAHVNERYCQGPDHMASSTLIGIQLAGCLDDKKANGGQGSIAEQIAASGVDVVLGGGLQYFQETAEGTDLTVLQQAEQQGYQVVTKGSDLASVAFDRKLLGLFAASTLPVLYTGDNAAHGKAQLVSDEQGSTQIPEPFHCIPNPKFTGTPTLKEMTETALRHLHQNTDRGFFLMVESASIDKQSHYRQPCGHIGETLQLNEALDTALAFAEKVPNTLVLVTADHSQAAQLVSEISPYLSPENTSVHSPGYFARVITREGGVMGVNYATTTFPMMEEHTGAQVPLFAGGSAIDQVHIPTAVNQPDIFTIMAEYLGLLPNRATLNSR